MRSLILIAAATFSIPAFAQADYQFQNFTVNHDKLNTPIKKGKSSKSNKSEKSYLVDSHLKVSPRQKVSDPEGLSDLESPLMSEIRDYLQNDYAFIRDEQRQLFLERGKSFTGTIKNLAGLRWQKPMGQYKLYMDRQVLPDAASDQWVASDQLVIAIDAKTYLGSLSDAGVINISESRLAAFAGLKFLRVYEYKYRVDSFEKGMTSHFDKLILGFLNFSDFRVDLLGANEHLRKYDIMGFYAGAMVDVPLKYGFSLSAGALVKAEKMSEVEIKTFSLNDIARNDTFLTVTAKQSKLTSVGAEIGLKLDLFNLIKLRLLSFEYHISREKMSSTSMSFKTADAYKFVKPSELTRSVASVLQFKSFNPVLDPYINSRRTSDTYTKTKNFSFFNSGSASESESTQYSVQRNGRAPMDFIEHISTDLSYVKGWKGALWDMTLQSSIGFDIFNDYKFSHKKKSKVEYEKTIYETEHSASMQQEFFVYNTVSKSSYKKRVIDFMSDYTYFNQQMVDNINNDKVQGPLKIKVKMLIRPELLFYLDQYSNRDAKDLIQEACGTATYRVRSTEIKECRDKVYKKLSTYRRKSRSYEDKVWYIKDFVSAVNKYVPSIFGIQKLFGPHGLYVTGQIEAKTDTNEDFKFYFESKQGYDLPSVSDRSVFDQQDMSPDTHLLKD